MKESPLIFSGPMVRANRAGIKRMTRRVAKLPPGAHNISYWDTPSGRPEEGYATPGINYWTETGNHIDRCPYGFPGDRIWVRETWRIAAWRDNLCRFACDYKASPEATHAPWIVMESQEWKERIAKIYAELGKINYPSKDGRYQWEHGKAPLRWHPSIHMPRWACRDVYTVTKVRVERLLNISNKDAIAEGVYQTRKNGWLWYDPAETETPHCSHALSPKQAFMWLWDSINAKRPGCSWAANPWVWVIEYDNPLWKGMVV